MSDGILTYAECVAQATAKGQIAVVPKSNELFVDIDDERQFQIFQKQVEVFCRGEKGVRWKMRPSPSGAPHHFHITLRLTRDVSNRDRILLQAVLGSDPMREILSLQRLDAGDPHPTLFFEKPEVETIASIVGEAAQ